MEIELNKKSKIICILYKLLLLKTENILTDVICVTKINRVIKYHNYKAKKHNYFCSLSKNKNILICF